MSSQTNPTKSGNQDDPWEQLAEDLFGLEYGKEHGSCESSTPEEEPVTPRAEPTPSDSEEDSRPEPASEASTSEVGSRHIADEPDFVAAQPASDEPEPSPERVEPTSPAAETGSPQDSYWDALANWNWDESEGPASKAKSEAPRSSGGPPRGASRGHDDKRDRRGGERPQRPGSGGSPAGPSTPPAKGHAARGQSATSSSAAPPPRSSISSESAPHAPRPAAKSPGDDFGLGVVDSESDFGAPQESRATEGHRPAEPPRPLHEADDRGASSPPVPAADHVEQRSGSGERGADQDPQKQKEGEFPRKRRRRRRRRSRGGDRAPGTTTGGTTSPSSPVSDDDWDDSAGPESDVAEDEPQTPVADSQEEIKDEFEGDRHVPARGRRHGSRNERTRHEETARRSNVGNSEVARSEGAFDGGLEDFEEEPLLAGGGVEESASADDGDDDAGEQAVSYENVPTWEEAISYLLHPNQVQVEPGAGNGSAPPRGAPAADQPRQTRHMGSPKHRR